ILPLLREAPHNVMEERSRGRIKKWSCWIAGAEGIDFPHASQAAVIRREIFEITGGRVSKEHALILTSRKAGKMTAADVNRNTRSHWGIENKSHYIRIPGRPQPGLFRRRPAGPRISSQSHTRATPHEKRERHQGNHGM